MLGLIGNNTCINSYKLEKILDFHRIHVNLGLIVFKGALMKNVVLDGSHMAGVNLRVANLKNANLKNCDLRGAVLAGADLEVRNVRDVIHYHTSGGVLNRWYILYP